MGKKIENASLCSVLSTTAIVFLTKRLNLCPQLPFYMWLRKKVLLFPE